VADDGFRVSVGDLLGVSSENAAWNLIGFDEDYTQRSVLRRRRFINGSVVFADLPRVTDVVDDFTTDTAPTRFSVAVQIAADFTTSVTTPGSDVTTASSMTTVYESAGVHFR